MDKGKGKKRKLKDETILAKARKHIRNPEPSEDVDDDIMPHVTEEEIESILNPVNTDEPSAPPIKKLRKPRHTEKKTKPVAEPTPEKAKKKKKKKKKSKSNAATPVKTPDSVERRAEAPLDFLQKWKHCRMEWKFEKLKQVWLLQNCLDPELIPEVSFLTLLEYMGSVRGQARTATEKDMGVAMKAYEVKQNPSEGDTSRYERARQILQILSSD